MRFSNKLTILLAILILFSGLIQFIAFDRIFLTTTDTLFLVTSEKAASNISENLSSYFRKTQNILKTIAADATLRKNQDMLEKVNALIPEINKIFILDTQGNVLYATGAKEPPDLNLSKRDYFQHAMQGKMYISNVFTSMEDRQVVAIAAPIIENNKVSGVVAATVWLHENYLASMFDNKSFGRNGLIMITDAQGVIVYHPNKTQIGKKAVVFDSLQGTSGTVTMANNSDQEQYIGYSKLPESNWLVAVHTPTAELKELRHLMIYQIVVVSIIAFLSAVTIGLYVLRRYMKPFEKLVQAFSSVRKGNYREIAPADYASEFDEMVRAYNLTVKKLEEVHNRLRGAADIDGLTGACNRRAFNQAIVSINNELESGSLRNLGIIFLDLDNLKDLNDTQGHTAGDDVLRDLVTLANTVVEPRTLFRYGGDEFVIMLRNLPRNTIISLAEEIRSQCEAELRGCTLSIGIATYPEDSKSVDELMGFADKALYISKGIRNKVTAYAP